ncbi:MAG TPA: LLM class flavin-dependent oxidoreductase [Candidatus Limnocylindrales bacterium]|jgi:alkanesulfonate monooxygenase SsuD/methylene tetrahydromethanopterin reductase-like flavin-dependent oxidoreductase (luciferase family)|nr:LLM class flavin-dependent oxidoreductase [Candidatus Limnocylindrales bacterium]
MAETRYPIRIGFDLDPSQTSWADMLDVVTRADSLGYDSLWTWDHLYATDDPRQSIAEGWTTIAAWAAITTRPTVGLLVGANTLRNPGLVAKSAVAVDHVSRGRCILGLGSGWRPREHRDHGIPFGSGFGERLDWLGESVTLIRGLLAGETVSSPTDAHYSFREARHLPHPYRGASQLPILIGGGGERRTIPLVARHADLWHHRGSVKHLTRKLDILREACAVIGRDPADIELTFDPEIVIRDDLAAARRVIEDQQRHHLAEPTPIDPDAIWIGPPDVIAERWRPYLELGFRHLICDLPSPYDRETVERLREVRALVGG